MEILADKGMVLSLILLLAVVMFFLRWSQRNMKASAQRIKEFSRRPTPKAPPGHNLDAPEKIAQWEVQMHDMTRDMAGQLDTKIAIATRLLRTAEERIARLEQVIERAERLRLPAPDESHDPRFRPLSESLSDPSHDTSISKDERYDEIYDLADEGFTSVAIAARVGSPIGEVELILSLRSKTNVGERN